MRWFLLFFASFAFANTTYTYEKWENKKKTPMTWEIKEKKGHLFLTCHENIGVTTVETLADFKNIQNYVFESADKKLSYNIQLKGKKLLFEKTNRGKKQKSEFKISAPWIQQFGFGLMPFVKSSKKKIKFALINTDKLDLVDMIAQKNEIVPLKIKDKEYQAQKVEVSLQGFKSMFWKAEMWFDKESGDMLKYVADSGPSTSVTTLLFISKEKSLFNFMKKDSKSSKDPQKDKESKKLKTTK